MKLHNESRVLGGRALINTAACMDYGLKKKRKKIEYEPHH
jgi:hypothetical protein